MSGTCFELRPVELQVLARGEVAVAAVVACARCRASLRSCRDDSRPYGIAMRSIGAWRWMYRPLCRRSGAELVLGQLAGEEAARLVAELRDPLVHQPLIDLRRRGTWVRRCYVTRPISSQRLVCRYTRYYVRLYRHISDHEAAAAPLPHRSRAPRPQRVRGGRGAAYLPARGLQADPRPRGRARHRRSSCATASAWSRSPSRARRSSRSPSASSPRRRTCAAPARSSPTTSSAPSPSPPPIPRRAMRCPRPWPRSSGAIRRWSCASTRATRPRSASRCSPARPILCVATEAIAQYPELVSLPVYQWNRCVVVPPKHPLLKVTPLTLEALAQHPIVTYDFAFANRSLVQKAFENRGLKPNVVLTRARLRRDQDLRRARPRASASSRRWRSTRSATPPARHRREPSVRVEHHAPGHQARRLPAALRLRVHRDVRAAPATRDRRARGRGARKAPATSYEGAMTARG